MHNMISLVHNTDHNYRIDVWNCVIVEIQEEILNRIFIDGAHGTTGLEIHERLAGRSDMEILEIDDSLRKDLSARVELANTADVTIMCLPDDASRELADAVPDDVRLIDTSTAPRTSEGWVYGMPELYEGKRQEIRNANRVANPGCHASGFIILARPLVDAGVISPDAVLSCFCVTGYSGGGKKMIDDFDQKHACTRAVSPMQYALGQSHKHLPEMAMMSGLYKAPVFCPVVGDFLRGMVMTIELPKELMSEDLGISDIKTLFTERYKDEPLINVVEGPETGFLESDTMQMKDSVEIMALGNDDRLILISRFDNLGKGASGAAVQNLNIMLGINETEGLRI